MRIVEKPSETFTNVLVRLSLMSDFLRCEAVRLYKEKVVLSLKRTEDNIRRLMSVACDFNTGQEDVENGTMDVEVTYGEISAYIVDSETQTAVLGLKPEE